MTPQPDLDSTSDENNPSMSTSSKILHKLQASSSSQSITAAVRVYLIRHGETNWNRKGKIQGGGYDVPLNENGKDQALKAGMALEGITLDAVASSALSRAKETADIVYEYYNSQNSNGKKPLRIVDQGFNEMRFGKFEGIRLPHRDRDSDISTEDEKKLNHFFDVKTNVWKDPDYCFLPRESSDDLDPEDEVYRVDDALSGKGESTNIVVERSIKALSETIFRVLKENDDDEKRTKHVAIVSHGRTNKILLGAMMDAGEETKIIKQSNANISVLDHPGWETDGVDAKGGWTARFINSTDHVKKSLKI